MKAKRAIFSVLTALFMVASLCAITAAPAGAQTISLTPDAGSGGTKVSVAGSGFAAETSFNIDFTDNANTTTQDLATGTTTSVGKLPLSTTITIPTDAATGDGTVTVNVDGTSETATFAVEDPDADDDADDGVGLKPNTGAVGTLVTITVGRDTDFPKGEEPLIVKYDGTEVDTTPAEPVTPATDESYPVTINFEVPNSDKGDHDVDVECGVSSSSEDFTVLPKVTIGDDEDQKGSTETVTCTGFDGNYSIDVFAGGDKVGSGATDSNGTAEVSCTMDYDGAITATDGAGNDAVYTPDTFTFEPGISLDPGSGPVDSEVTIEGSGFTEGAVIVTGDPYGGNDAFIEFAGDELHSDAWGMQEWYDAGDDAEVNEDGEFEVDFDVPGDATAGTKKVKIQLPNGEDASDTFVVGTPTIDLDVTEGPEGQTVGVTGSGFAAEVEDYSLSFDKGDDGFYTGIDELKTIDTDADGEFTTSFEVPDVTGDKDEDYDVGVLTTTGGTALAEATFHVIASDLAVSPEEGPTGTEVTVTGTGYPASENFSIVFEDAAPVTYVLANVASSSLGEFTTTVTIPANSAIGDGTIRDTEEENEADFEVTAAEALVKVEDGLSGIWGSVDESVWYFDNASKEWKQYYKANPDAVPEEKQLTSMAAGNSYWIHVTEDCELKYGGHVYSLSTGWNSIGWIG